MCIVPGGGGVKGVVERRHSRLLDVEHVWKRLEDDQLIVGMLIKNISEQYVALIFKVMFLTLLFLFFSSTGHCRRSTALWCSPVRPHPLNPPPISSGTALLTLSLLKTTTSSHTFPLL